MSRLRVLAAALAVTIAGGSASKAHAGGMEFFFNNTSGAHQKPAPVFSFPKWPSSTDTTQTSNRQPIKASISQEGSANATPKQRVLTWFENFDDLIYTMGISDHERYILKRPINQEAERLKEWIDATNSMARKYRVIARKIRAMAVMQSIADIKEFQSESANWYDDNAQLCEDLTVPRRPAKTYEELERAYNGFMMRSKNLAELSKSITELNTKLRDKYDVHQPKYVDPSAKYIDSVVHHMQEK